jgi:hypothetical protein
LAGALLAFGAIGCGDSPAVIKESAANAPGPSMAPARPSAAELEQRLKAQDGQEHHVAGATAGSASGGGPGGG